MNVIELGAMVGPAADIEVIAVARVDRTTGVFVGRSYEKDLRTPKFVISHFDLGADWWHSGDYSAKNEEAALSSFVGRIIPGAVVFRP